MGFVPEVLHCRAGLPGLHILHGLQGAERALRNQRAVLVWEAVLSVVVLLPDVRHDLG